VARAISVTAFTTARPTLRSSGSFKVMRQTAVASSLLAGSGLSVRTSRVVTLW